MKSVLAFLFLVLSFHAYAQQTLIATVEISDVESAYVDRPGDLYILQKNNTIKKYDTLGAFVSEYEFPESPVAFDPRDGARLFACFTSTKKCSFFSAETKNEFRIEPQYAIEPHLITSSGDHNWWILDQSDVSLKRVNPVQSSVMADALIDQKQFTQTPEFVFMREYQNFLFLVEKNSGLLIFNSLGNQIKKIPAAGVEYINFLGEELYYKKKGTLFFYDLFDASTREMAVDPGCRYVLLTDARKYLVYGDRLEIHRNR